MKTLSSLALSIVWLITIPLTIFPTYAHIDSEIELIMKDMGGNLKSIRGNDNKAEVLSALDNIKMLSEKAANKTPYIIENNETDKSLEEYQQGMQNFIQAINEIIEQVKKSDDIDGSEIFQKINDMKKRAHDYFSIH